MPPTPMPSWLWTKPDGIPQADDATEVVVRLARFAHTRLVVVAECDAITELAADEIEELLS